MAGTMTPSHGIYIIFICHLNPGGRGKRECYDSFSIKISF